MDNFDISKMYGIKPYMMTGTFYGASETGAKCRSDNNYAPWDNPYYVEYYMSGAPSPAVNSISNVSALKTPTSGFGNNGAMKTTESFAGIYPFDDNSGSISNNCKTPLKLIPYGTQYLNGYLQTQIGKNVETELLTNNNSTITVEGTLLNVGINFIIIKEEETNDNVVCDLSQIICLRISG